MVALIEDVGRRHGVKVGTFGHMETATCIRLFCAMNATRKRCTALRQRCKEVFDGAIELGGTITGEHGVGLAKKPFLPAQLGEVGIAMLRPAERQL